MSLSTDIDSQFAKHGFKQMNLSRLSDGSFQTSVLRDDDKSWKIGLAETPSEAIEAALFDYGDRRRVRSKRDSADFI